MRAQISALLATKVPQQLVDDLLDAFDGTQRDLITRRLGGSSPGKFVETFVQILQHLQTGRYDSQPSVESFLRPLESQASPLDDGLRVVGSRIARSLYTIRSKRNVVHKGEVDMNLIDLRLAHAQTRWLLSELLRQVAGSSMADAGRLIEQLDVPLLDIVEVFGGRQIVNVHLSVPDEILVQLHSVYPDAMLISDLKQNMHRRAVRSIEKSLRSMWKARDVEELAPKTWKLTQPGYAKALSVLSAITS